jgi:hypothetical protein
MLAGAAISEAALSESGRKSTGPGGSIVEASLAEVTVAGDASVVVLATVAFLIEITAVDGVAVPPAVAIAQVGESLFVSASYLAGGFWSPEAVVVADWATVNQNQDLWQVVAGGDDSWIKQ